MVLGLKTLKKKFKEMDEEAMKRNEKIRKEREKKRKKREREWKLKEAKENPKKFHVRLLVRGNSSLEICTNVSLSDAESKYQDIRNQFMDSSNVVDIKINDTKRCYLKTQIVNIQLYKW